MVNTAYLTATIIADCSLHRFAYLPVEVFSEVAELQRAAAVCFVLAKGYHPPQIVYVSLSGSEILSIHCYALTTTTKRSYLVNCWRNETKLLGIFTFDHPAHAENILIGVIEETVRDLSISAGPARLLIVAYLNSIISNFFPMELYVKTTFDRLGK